MKLRKQGNTTYSINFLLTLSNDHITGATGKSPTLTISKNGGAFGAPVGAVTELAHGWYTFTPAAADMDTKGELLLHASTDDCDPYDEKYEVGGINLFDALNEIAAAVWNYAVASWGAVSTAGGWLKQALDTLLTRTSGGVTVVAPVNALTGSLEVIRGDDYTVSSGRALPAWVSDDWTPYDLSTATAIQFRAQPATGGTVFTKAVTALSDTEVRLELTDTETAAFSVGKDAYVFDISAVLLTGDVVTLVRGKMTVLRDVR